MIHECVQLFIQRSHSYTVRCSAHALSLRIVFGLHFLFPFFSRVQVVCKFKKIKSNTILRFCSLKEIKFKKSTFDLN